MTVHCSWAVYGPTQERSVIRIEQGDCPNSKWGHRASRVVDQVPSVDATFEGFDPEPPEACECGHVFTGESRVSKSAARMLILEDGSIVSPKDAPPGTMWDADYMPDGWKGPDGRALIVVLPTGPGMLHHWHIDGSASNCDQPDREHHCWVRTGEPPNITVGKGAPGESCTAGAGSIGVPGYHGFLRNGAFT